MHVISDISVRMAPPLQISERRIQAFRRFIDKLPHGKDPDLVILKAHLLMEEQVSAIIAVRLANPKVLLDEENLQSAYRLKFAQAFFPEGSDRWLWQALTKLNTLRNRIAHRIEPRGRDALMLDIVRLVPGASGAPQNSPQEQFEWALWFMHEAVSALVEGVPTDDAS